MSELNFNSVSAIFGKRGTGKTEYLKGNSDFNLPGFLNLYLQQKKMKVLIVDTFDHPSYRDIPSIAPENFSKWKKGAYRIFVRVDEMPDLCNQISEDVWNTLIVFEDAHKHQYNRIDKSIMRLIGDSKQKNIDIVFMYHNWALAPKDLYRYLDFIECFKTKDHPSCRKDDMPGYYDEALKVYEEVKSNPSPFCHKLIRTDL